MTRAWRNLPFALTRACRRSYSESASHLPSLPPHEEWRRIFDTANNIKERACIKRVDTARLVVESFLGDKSPAGGEDKVVIEAFPGPGALSRALLELPRSKLRKLIILEDNAEYLPHLKALELVDTRVHVVPYSGFLWDTYTYLEDTGLLSDIQPVPWENGIHPNLHFISHLQRSIKGEQLIAQLFRCIPDRTWLYRYGRVPMSFLMSDWVRTRMAAPPGNSVRCKLSVIAEAVAKCHVSLKEELQPYEANFHPVASRGGGGKKPITKRIGHPFVAMNIIPHEDQFITKGTLDKWDYCLRRLFVLKSTPLTRCINSLAPGASILLKALTDPTLPFDQRVEVNKAPRGLTVADWALLVRAFDQWPFAPEVCACMSYAPTDAHCLACRTS
ncbi:S-adenosyl-L-methionine-dependent methyltransferase [Rhodofomes roseus]|uniref:rRNA adenine N(6)-methyltransferase n=1 Tax=Rhodofomes roseus TaxID=34475 RepID=A0ABQ8K371_9APHY|nr:S-adenosyl-L-methionine-dependent methyltransferase [Rhodofomes roseus]KAH9831248.1 S-adenosyl-L-methionine-dependent methyltransferase [Rhodofomes roseus]